MSETIARLLGWMAWMAVFWPRRPQPQGKHRRGVLVSADQAAPVIVCDQAAWVPCIWTARARRRARYGPSPCEPPSWWIDTGPLVRAYVLAHEQRQHAQAVRSLGGVRRAEPRE